MRVIRAAAMGMCFGVRDAILAAEQVENPRSFTIHGELVHNDQVNKTLENRGFSISGEVNRGLPATPGVLVTAHGVSNAELQRLEAAGKNVINTTCPLVRRAHNAAVLAEQGGWHVIIAGKRNHVEVLGLTGDLKNFTIMESPADACYVPYSRLAIVCQTTLPPPRALEILEAVRRENPASQIKLIDTICRPTKDRQKAMVQLIAQCDALVVVGGAHSNNTRQLVSAAQRANKPVQHVTCAADLDTGWATQFEVIGLTAGTSTPDSEIDAVHEKLSALSKIGPGSSASRIYSASVVAEVAHV